MEATLKITLTVFFTVFLLQNHVSSKFKKKLQKINNTFKLIY